MDFCGELYGQTCLRQVRYQTKILSRRCQQDGILVNFQTDDIAEHSSVEPIQYFLELRTLVIKTYTRLVLFWLFLEKGDIGWGKIFFQDIVCLNLLSNDDPVIII